MLLSFSLSFYLSIFFYLEKTAWSSDVTKFDNEKNKIQLYIHAHTKKILKFKNVQYYTQDVHTILATSLRHEMPKWK